jgi:acetate kinase
MSSCCKKDVRHVLVVNSGSSSLKFTLFDMAEKAILAKGIVERIGADNANLVYARTGGAKTEEAVEAKNHTQALSLVTKKLVDPAVGVLKALSDVDAIGHRVLHGGELFKESSLVEGDVLERLDTLVPLGPLHMPANIGGIRACQEIFPGVPNVAVFDTAFHQTMPDYVSHYGISEEYYRKYAFRKYGFHGTSHRFVTRATAEFLGKRPEETTIVTCHLGNGSSIAAIKNGKVFDTSMGLTPLAGLVMGTRSGDLDPAVVLELIRHGMSADEVDTLLNKKSGMWAVGGIQSGDMRDLEAAAGAGNADAERALEMWAHRVALYVGGYYTVLGGADAIVFTGGIGENSSGSRARVMKRLAALGTTLDIEANKGRGGPRVISTPDSALKAIVISTDEELMIAQDTVSLCAR